MLMSHLGRARPEEVIWAIKKGRIHKGVPRDIMRFVDRLDITSQHEFTAYEEGSPKHPSWPGMLSFDQDANDFSSSLTYCTLSYVIS